MRGYRSLAIHQAEVFPLCFGFRLVPLLPLAFGRLCDQTLFKRLRGHADVADLAVHDGFDSLQIRHETALGDGGHVRADAAGLLGFSAAPDDAAIDWPFAGQFTNSSHTVSFLV